jgi:uncharacterized protein YecE (DUF72 family)
MMNNAQNEVSVQQSACPQPLEKTPVYIGCAGWSLPKSYAQHFPPSGTHLERYAAVFHGVEINSSFYRPHKPQTYAKWAAAVPEQFRFSAKVPKLITHQQRLKNTGETLKTLLSEVAALGDKLGPLLVQLPPSLVFDENVAELFFSTMRSNHGGQVVCEPRHLSWFTSNADDLLAGFNISRVAADPALVPEAAEPGGWNGLVYYRLHGSPTIYRSAYESEFLHQLSMSIQAQLAQSVPVWCIFDNTAEGEATGNALDLIERLR